MDLLCFEVTKRIFAKDVHNFLITTIPDLVVIQIRIINNELLSKLDVLVESCVVQFSLEDLLDAPLALVEFLNV